MVRVLFVCLGNICRSPMAEGVFRQLVEHAGLAGNFEIDSAGTGSWHVGEQAHSGTRRVLAKHGINYLGRARRVKQTDLVDPETYLIAMDRENLVDLQSMVGEHPRLFRLLDFATQTERRDVPDPYYNGNFDEVYQLVEDGCRGLLAHIIEQENLTSLD